MNYIIYKTTNLVNGKFYVGQHNNSNGYYLGSGVVLKKAIEKYGRENFERTILEDCIEENVNEREIFWIKKLKAVENGYNLHEGGVGGNVVDWTEERRESRRGDKNPSKRKEVREKISKFWKGRKRSKEFGKNISERMKGTKKSIEERTNRSKWIYKFTNENTGQVLQTDALNLFCEEIGWKQNSINESVCRGRNKYKCWKIERSLKEDLL